MSWIKEKAEIFGRLLGTLGVLALALAVINELNARVSDMFPAGPFHYPRSFVIILAYLAACMILSIIALWFPEIFAPLQRLRQSVGRVNWLLAVLITAFPCWLLLYTKWGSSMNGPYVRVLLYLSALVIAAWLCANRSEQAFEWPAAIASILMLGSVFAMASALTYVQGYPFSMGWSEGNRLWDYSVLYGRGLYIFPDSRPPKAYIDLGRQSLWGLPFLLGRISIQMERLWSVLVFSVPYALFGWFVFRFKKTSGWVYLFLGLWCFLFLNQGPIYTPLVLAAILVAASWRRPLWLAVILVGLASYYARYSRSTWLFAPGMWAAMVALVSTTIPGFTTPRRRWLRAITLGLAGIVGGYILPEILPRVRASLAGTAARASIISVEGLTSAVNRQPLLWDRLWPNPTYSPGIVLGLLYATLPLMLVLILFYAQRRWKLDIWQKLALVGGLALFLGVGIVVSVKIGGGGNLHNLDMFLIGLVFALALAWEVGLGDWILAHQPNGRPWWLSLLVLAAVIYPASQGMLSAGPMGLPADTRAAQVLQVIRDNLARYSSKGEILFIDNRQLLTFGFVQNISLVNEYEKKLMMDEAMAEDMKYFAPFYKDLANQRFQVIITEPLREKYQGDSYHFGNENDAWVRFISIPVLCYYEPDDTFEDVGVQILLPRQPAGQECSQIPQP